MQLNSDSLFEVAREVADLEVALANVFELLDYLLHAISVFAKSVCDCWNESLQVVVRVCAVLFLLALATSNVCRRIFSRRL